MRTALLSTIAAATLIAAPALSQTIVAYDSLSAKFSDKREVVDSVQQLYGETIAYEKGETLPDTITSELVPGNTLPGDAPTREVDPELADMIEDNLPEGARWVEVGPHLVAVDQEDRIVMVVYDVVG